MQVFIGADHNGYEMKNALVSWLKEEGHEVVDAGPAAFDKYDDYPDFGHKVARAVAEKPEERYGIVLCGSGVGMAVVADKVKGIRAGLIHDPEIARVAQRDDNINVLALGARYISLAEAKAVITAWLTTPFIKEERYIRRLKKITQIEEGTFI